MCIVFWRACAPYVGDPSHILGECPTLFRKPLQFIVIAVMSVMSGAFPDTNGVFYVTINSWRVRGPSCHRHGERHVEIGLCKGFLVGMTMMTLMTMVCGLILNRGCASTSWAFIPSLSNIPTRPSKRFL